MTNTARSFLHEAEAKAFDLKHRKTLNHNISQYDESVKIGLSYLSGVEYYKKKAHTIKWRVMENLDKFLLEFETNFQKRGGKVIWANDAAEAQVEILKILQKNHVKTVVKSKSMTTEEIHINEYLEKHDI